MISHLWHTGYFQIAADGRKRQKKVRKVEHLHRVGWVVRGKSRVNYWFQQSKSVFLSLFVYVIGRNKNMKTDKIVRFSLEDILALIHKT